MKSTVAILLATYNGEQFLREQLDSLLNQTYKEWICYVHDDGSTDRTLDILEEYAHVNKGKFVLLDYAKTRGAKNNFMSLIAYASKNVAADYFMFCDQDDVWLNNKINLSLEKIQEEEMRSGKEKPILAFSDLYVVDAQLNIISDSFFKYGKKKLKHLDIYHLISENLAPGCCMIINKRLCKMAALYDEEEWHYIEMHDWWCILIAALCGKVTYLSDSTIQYRQHEKNSIGAKDKSSKSHFILRIKEHFNGQVGKELVRGMQIKNKFSFLLIKHFNDINSQEIDFLKKLYKIRERNKFLRFIFFIKNGMCHNLHHAVLMLLYC